MTNTGERHLSPQRDSGGVGSSGMNEADIILTGVPRSGTTLTCNLLNKLPDTVALHEPMRGAHVRGHEDNRSRLAAVQRFFAEQRHSILQHGRASSRTTDGAMPVNPFGAERSASGLRRHLDSRGEVAIDKELSPDFTLVIKHLGSFTALLPELVGEFPVYAVVRNPLAALASWATLDAPLQRGRLGVAEVLDTELGDRLGNLDDPLDRQLALLDWFFAQFHNHLPERAVIRYEELISSKGRALAAMTPAARDLDEPLASRNSNGLYDHDQMRRLGERLLRSDGAWSAYYPRESLELLLAELSSNREQTSESVA